MYCMNVNEWMYVRMLQNMKNKQKRVASCHQTFTLHNMFKIYILFSFSTLKKVRIDKCLALLNFLNYSKNFGLKFSSVCMRCSVYMMHAKKLTVLHSAVPEIKIMDERNSKVKEQIIYEWGSTIELRCVVSNLVGDQPEYIIWKKDDRMLNYDLERGGIRYSTIK